MTFLTDAEAVTHLRAAVEFVEAVEDRDPAWVEACLRFTEARTLAVWCADMLLSTRELLKLREAECAQAVRDLAETEATLQAEMRAASRNRKRLESSNTQLRSEVRELRDQLTTAHQKIARLQGDLYIAKQKEAA